MTPAGWKIWYGDGHTVTSREMAWDRAPSTNVQCVAEYFEETYDIFLNDGYNETGYPINQRLVTENYRELYFGKDYYWYDPMSSSFGAGNAADVPTTALIKLGQEIEKEDYHAILYRVYEDRHKP